MFMKHKRTNAYNQRITEVHTFRWAMQAVTQPFTRSTTSRSPYITKNERNGKNCHVSTGVTVCNSAQRKPLLTFASCSVLLSRACTSPSRNAPGSLNSSAFTEPTAALSLLRACARHGRSPSTRSRNT
jgi:hypothetical protein